MQLLYTTAANAFRDAHKTLQERKDSLDKFLEACRKSKHSLPNSLQLRICERAKLPSVLSAPTLCSEETAELAKMEMETSKAVHDIVLKAKNKEIDHLTRTINVVSFAAAQIDAFTAGVNSDFNDKPADETREIRGAIMQHFTLYIHDKLASIEMQQREFLRAREQDRKQRLTDSLAAQGRILGQSSAQTIAEVAASSVARSLGPVHRDISQLKAKLQPKRHRPSDVDSIAATTAASAASASSFTLHPAFFAASSAHLKEQGGDRSNKKQRRPDRNEL